MIQEVLFMFGEYIKTCRKAKKLTQKQLGEMCGYSGRAAEVTVQEWEHDRRPVPLEKIRPLATALGIPIDSLIP